MVGYATGTGTGARTLLMCLLTMTHTAVDGFVQCNRYTTDMAKASRVARGIKAGQVGINNWPLENAPAACPWVGARGSGFGYHSGKEGAYRNKPRTHKNIGVFGLMFAHKRFAITMKVL